MLLEAVDNNPIGSRVPLILVHGNDNENKPETKYDWNYYIQRYQDSKDSKYKLYLYKWESTKSSYINGLRLGASIEAEEELFDTRVVILAHSRGGLVSRHFMNNYIGTKGVFAGQKGGERVNALITLATPHQGSPGADPIWALFSFNNLNQQNIINDSFEYVLTHKYLSLFDINSYQYLQWDDVDKEVTDDIVCFSPWYYNDGEICSVLMHTMDGFQELAKLNETESYKNKIIAYGGSSTGNITNELLYFILLGGVPTNDHDWLSIGSLLMATMPVIPNGYPDTKINNYRFFANDGMVPLSSALFLKEGSGNLFQLLAENIIYDIQLFDNKCQLQECNLINNRYTDHKHFLDDVEIIDMVINRLQDIAIY